MKSAGFDDMGIVPRDRDIDSEKMPTLTRRKSEIRCAAAKSIGEQGLRSGVIVRYQDRLYVVKTINPEGMDLVVLNGPLRVTHKLPVVAASSRGTHTPLVAVEYLPQSGFVHMRSVTFACKSILAEDNAMLFRRLQKELGKDDVYDQPPFGTFWREAKVATFKKNVWRRSQLKAAS